MSDFDIFVKTYAADYGWCEYLCRSIDKYVHGFRRVIFIAPDENCPRPTKTESVLVVQPECANGYLSQQAHKLYADTHTDAGHILHVDSDCVFVRDVQPQSFFQEGKPIWLHTPWGKIDEPTKAAWQPVMRKFAGYDAPSEGMRRHGILWPRWLYSELRGFSWGRHGISLWDYVMTQGDRSFSEFNCAFAYAFRHHPDKFTFLSTDEPFPPDYVRQWWSYGGITPQIRAEIEQILS